MSNESRLDEARKDCLISQAPSSRLVELSRLNGLEWIISERITDEAQRAFLRATLYGARSTYSGFFSSVRALFSYAEVSLPLTLTKQLNTAFITGQGLTDSWGLDRFIFIESPVDGLELTRSTHSETVNNQLRIYLSPVSTSSHREKRLFLVGSQTENITASLLPFRILEPQPSQRGISQIERPCEVILELFDLALSDVPPSYYRENGDPRTLDPQGLQMMSLNSSTPFANRQSGPFPLYYDAGERLSEHTHKLLDKLLPSGIKLTAKRNTL